MPQLQEAAWPPVSDLYRCRAASAARKLLQQPDMFMYAEFAYDISCCTSYCLISAPQLLRCAQGAKQQPHAAAAPKPPSRAPVPIVAPSDRSQSRHPPQKPPHAPNPPPVPPSAPQGPQDPPGLDLLSILQVGRDLWLRDLSGLLLPWICDLLVLTACGQSEKVAAKKLRCKQHLACQPPDAQQVCGADRVRRSRPSSLDMIFVHRLPSRLLARGVQSHITSASRLL